MTEAALARTLVLHCHPATPAGVALSLNAEVQVARDEWVLHYRLRGPMASLRIPPPSTTGPADGLWQHTCFEAFVAAEGEQAYREFNFSPSRQWAAYRFAAERERDAVTEAREPATAPDLRTVIEPEGLQLTARLPRAALPRSDIFHLGLCAVIEEADGRLSYWALKHPHDRPDFHHRDGRALRLAAS